MPLLIIQESGYPPRLFEIKQEPLIIGRSPESGLLLPNVSVSRRHAKLSIQPSGSATIENLSQSNALMVNDGVAKEKHNLSSGDQIRLGKFKLIYLHEDALDIYQVQQLTEMTPFNRRGDDLDQPTHSLPVGLLSKLIQIERLRESGSLRSMENNKQIWIIGSSSVELGPNQTIPAKSRFGRGPTAILQWSGGGHELRAVGLMTRIKVNGMPIKNRILRVDDEIDINGSIFTYELTDKTG